MADVCSVFVFSLVVNGDICMVIAATVCVYVVVFFLIVVYVYVCMYAVSISFLSSFVFVGCMRPVRFFRAYV